MYRIEQGDCLELMDSIEPGSVDLVLIDPPYGIMGKTKDIEAFSAPWDKVIEPAWLFKAFERVLSAKRKALVFSREPLTSKITTSATGKMVFNYRMAWVKPRFGNPLSCKRAPLNYFEDICVFSKIFGKEGSSVFNLAEGTTHKSNVFCYPKDSRTGEHPTQKPVALLEDLIKTYSNPGDTVLDFVMGSGSTGVACANTGRRFVGFELDAGYFETAKKRVSDAYENEKSTRI